MSAGELAVRTSTLTGLVARWSTVGTELQGASGGAAAGGPWSSGVSAAVAEFESQCRESLTAGAAAAHHASSTIEVTSTAYDVVDELVRSRFERLRVAG